MENIKILLDNDRIDVNKPDNYGLTPFHNTCLRGQKDILKMLLKSDRVIITDIPIEVIPDDRKYLYKYDNEIIELLKTVQQFDVDKFMKIMNDNYHKSLLMITLDNSNNDTFETDMEKIKSILADPEYDINRIDSWRINFNNTTAFHYVCSRLDTHYGKLMQETANLLFNDPRTDMNLQDGEGRSPFWWCCYGAYDEWSFVETMLNDPRVDVNKEDRNECTPFNCLMKYNYRHVHDFMLNSERIDMNKPDNKGRTPFFNAVDNNDCELIERLLKIDKIDPNIPNNDGITPFHYACLYLQIDMIKILLQSDRINMTDFPTGEECKINKYVYNDDAYDELINILSNNEKTKFTNIVDRINKYIY